MAYSYYKLTYYIQTIQSSQLSIVQTFDNSKMSVIQFEIITLSHKNLTAIRINTMYLSNLGNSQKNLKEN